MAIVSYDKKPGIQAIATTARPSGGSGITRAGPSRLGRDGIYDYVHYHSRIHEVLGIARGEGKVRKNRPHAYPARVQVIVLGRP